MNIELGDTVVDVITHFEGTVTARFEYLNGCVRWAVTGTDKDDQPIDYTFDEEQLAKLGVNESAKGIIARRSPTGGARTTLARR